MPASPESFRLAQQHRDDQLANSEGYKAEFATLWAFWSVVQSPAQRRSWLAANVNLIKRYRARAQAIARRYYQRARVLDAGAVLPELPQVEPASDAELVRNLLDRSAGVYKRARLVGLDEFEAAERARAAAEAAGERLVLNGGRDAIEQIGNADRDAIGWMRVSDGDPCSFCSLIVSRGAVYESRATAGGNANSRFVGAGMFKFHDSCGCTVAPVFTRNEFMSAEAKNLRDIYDEATVGKSGAEARNEFRRALEGRTDGPRRAS
jgi:hypothetical protein